MSGQTDILLEGYGLAADRGGRRVYEALDISLNAGEMVVLRGANGSGKSTLLRQLSGLLGLAAGDLLVTGAGVQDDPAAHKAALHYVGHADALKTALTLADNLDLYARTILGEITDSDTIRAAAETLDLSALLLTPVRYFSAGQRHRSSLVRLLLQHRPVWLLDEPTVGLDAVNRERLASMLKAHLAMGGGAIVATHEDLGVEGRILQVDEFTPRFDDVEAW